MLFSPNDFFYWTIQTWGSWQRRRRRREEQLNLPTTDPFACVINFNIFAFHIHFSATMPPHVVLRVHFSAKIIKYRWQMNRKFFRHSGWVGCRWVGRWNASAVAFSCLFCGWMEWGMTVLIDIRLGCRCSRHLFMFNQVTLDACRCDEKWLCFIYAFHLYKNVKINLTLFYSRFNLFNIDWVNPMAVIRNSL